jgi:hypothetical protein
MFLIIPPRLSEDIQTALSDVRLSPQSVVTKSGLEKVPDCRMMAAQSKGWKTRDVRLGRHSVSSFSE